jgi:hypothetical protein
MKKTLALALLLSSFVAAQAQTGKSYLMMNFNLQSQKNGFYQSYYNHGRSISNNPIFPVGFQYIRNFTDNSAMRFGITLYQKNIMSNYNFYTIGDTSFQKYTSYDAVMPKISIGKEWQKHIHKDVDIYGGADVGFGMMKSNKMYNTDKYTSNSTGSYYYGSSMSNTSSMIYNVSARPFAGIRVNWNRFTIGYEASLPINYTQVASEDIRSIDKPILQHQLNLGYKFGGNKRR